MHKPRLYRMGPLLLASELHIPELPEEEHGQGPVVAVRLGRVPASLTGALLVSPVQQASKNEYLLHIANIGSFHVQNGESVTIQPSEYAAPLDLRTYLLGIIFAVLCHQRGLLPLHASAVQTPRGAIAFLGDSGAGKSSLAAFLGRRGFPIVADDICLIHPNATRGERVLPVAPWLKLWRDTLNLLDETPERLTRTFSTDDKYRLPLGSSAQPLPLAEVIFLERVQDPMEAPSLEPIRPAQAVHQLMRYTFRLHLMSSTGQIPVLFQRCGKALEGARALRLHRPWGFERMDEVLTVLASHFENSSRPVRS